MRARTLMAAEPDVVAAMANRLARTTHSAPGWAVMELPADMDDEKLRLAATGVLAALGSPFNSIEGSGEVWIGSESTAGRDAASFGGLGAQGLHIDAPNVEQVPDYTTLLIVRPDPAGGGQSLIGDLRAALAELDDDDHALLRRPVFSEGRAENLRGVGEVWMPFPVLQDAGPGQAWIRWAAKMLPDPRNTGQSEVLGRFAAALERHTTALALTRGQVLIADQQRIAHGRSALGQQGGQLDGTRRLLLQAKVRYEADAPAQQSAALAGDAR